jgi:catechol 2,3-dioxygenase-like lactoylglutathione lyase family enzyme
MTTTDSPCITAFQHIGIVVDDLEGAIAFWRDFLGLEPFFERTRVREAWLAATTGLPHPSMRFVHLRGHGIAVELIRFIDDDGTPWEGRKAVGGPTGRFHWTHVCFEVDDAWAWHKRARGYGHYPVSEPQENPSGPRRGALGFFVRGPSSFVELWQAPRA